MTDEQRRHRVLAGVSRSRLLAELRRARRPMGVRELAASVDLHPNTAREHLDQLVEAELVIRDTAPPAGRGRPALRYRVEPELTDDAVAYRALAHVLASELAERPDAEAAAVRAGERWGSAVAGSLPDTASQGTLERFVGLLDDLGFAPDATGGDGSTIRLRRCPFASLARERGDVACGTHLGLMRGALRELDAPLDAVALEPFVEPDLCLAHLGARDA